MHGSSRPICSIFEKEYSVLFISDTVAYGISSTALVTSLEQFSTECKLIRLVLLCTVIVVLFFIDCQCLSSAVISTVVYMASRRRISLRPCNWHPTCLHVVISGLLPATPTLVIPSTRRSTLDDRVFPVAAALTWNTHSSIFDKSCSATYNITAPPQNRMFNISFNSTWPFSYHHAFFILIFYSALTTACCTYFTVNTLYTNYLLTDVSLHERS